MQVYRSMAMQQSLQTRLTILECDYLLEHLVLTIATCGVWFGVWHCTAWRGMAWHGMK